MDSFNLYFSVWLLCQMFPITDEILTTELEIALEFELREALRVMNYPNLADNTHFFLRL